jgi:hypothetical protein
VSGIVGFRVVLVHVHVHFAVGLTCRQGESVVVAAGVESGDHSV